MIDYASGFSINHPMNAYHKGVEYSVFNPVATLFQAHYSHNVALTVEGVVGDQYIQKLAQLEEDWDGYGAERIDSTVISQARDSYAYFCRCTSAPELSPNAHGTISFEWSSKRGTAHLEIGVIDFSFYLQPSFGDSFYLQDKHLSSEREKITRLINSELFTSLKSENSIGKFYVGSRGVRATESV